MRIDVLSTSAGREPHLGDEAALHGLLRELAARGVEALLAEPAGPAATAPGAARSGAAGAADEPTGQSCAPLDPGGAQPPEAVEQRAPEAEGLLLAGTAGHAPVGPELPAGWLGAARAAVERGRPVVISGLALDVRSAPVQELRELLTAASLVGLRDERSRLLASRLCPDHPALHLGPDDALLLPGPAPEPSPEGEPPQIVAALGCPDGPFGADEAASVLSALLDALAHRTSAAVTVMPCGAAAADAEFAAAVAAGLPADVRPRVLAPGEGADALVRAADHVVTTCPRAMALGLAAAAHVLPVATSTYAVQRMDGVLALWGLPGQAVPLAALLTPGDAAWDTRAAVQEWAAQAMAHRATVRSAVAGAAPALRAAGDRWWDGVVEAVRGGRPRRPPSAPAAPRGVGAPVVDALRRRYVAPAQPPARPTVAVVLHTRGRPGTPARALDDVLGQTFTDWRLVVVDDGGDPDEVDELLAAREDELAGRVTVLHRRRSLGPAAAANRGLRAADSELVVVRLEEDEPWAPTLLQRAVARLEDPLAGDDGVVVRTEAGEPAWPGALTLAGALSGERTVSGPFVYRRAVHGVLGDYDESLAAAADWEFGLRFLETFTVGLVPGPPHPVRARRTGAGPALRREDELLVRERHLRQWTAENGIGLPLHLSRELRDRAEALHERLDGSETLARELLELVREQSVRIERLERAVAQRGFGAFWRRVRRALRGR